MKKRSIFIMLCSVIFCSILSFALLVESVNITHASYIDSLVINGDFEDTSVNFGTQNPGTWYTNGITASYSEEYAHSSSHSIKATGGQAWDSSILYRTTAVDSYEATRSNNGKTLSVKGYMFAPSQRYFAMRVDIVTFNGGWASNVFNASQNNWNDGGNWLEFTIDVTINKTDNGITLNSGNDVREITGNDAYVGAIDVIFFAYTAQNASDTFYVDDVSAKYTQSYVQEGNLIDGSFENQVSISDDFVSGGYKKDGCNVTVTDTASYSGSKSLLLSNRASTNATGLYRFPSTITDRMSIANTSKYSFKESLYATEVFYKTFVIGILGWDGENYVGPTYYTASNSGWCTAKTWNDLKVEFSITKTSGGIKITPENGTMVEGEATLTNAISIAAIDVFTRTWNGSDSPIDLYIDNVEIRKLSEDVSKTITFDKNSTQAEGSITSIVEDYGTEITIPSGFTNNGYKFLGYATSATGTPVYQPEDKVNITSSMTLYAIWDKLYTLSFDKNAEDATGSITSIVKTSSEEITIPGGYSREGYTFKGYATTDKGSVAYSVGDKMNLSADVTLFAIWEENKQYYTLSYDKNSDTATGTINSVQKESGDKQTISGGFENEGYQFSGYALTATGAVAYNIGDEFTYTQDTTLYAIWAKLYTLSFNKNNAQATGSMNDITNVVGTSITLTNGFSLEGYSFCGFSLEENGQAIYEVGDNIELNNDLTLYAIWQSYVSPINQLGSTVVNGNFEDTTISIGSALAEGTWFNNGANGKHSTIQKHSGNYSLKVYGGSANYDSVKFRFNSVVPYNATRNNNGRVFNVKSYLYGPSTRYLGMYIDVVTWDGQGYKSNLFNASENNWNDGGAWVEFNVYVKINYSATGITLSMGDNVQTVNGNDVVIAAIDISFFGYNTNNVCDVIFIDDVCSYWTIDETKNSREIVNNFGFENDETYSSEIENGKSYQNGATLATTSDISISGNKSVKISNRTDIINSGLIYRLPNLDTYNMTVYTSSTYDINSYVFGPQMYGQLIVAFLGYDGTNYTQEVYLASANNNWTIANEWTKLSISFKVEKTENGILITSINNSADKANVLSLNSTSLAAVSLIFRAYTAENEACDFYLDNLSVVRRPVVFGIPKEEGAVAGEVVSLELASGTKIIDSLSDLSNPTLSGYTFDSWTLENGDAIPSTLVMGNDDIFVYAKYTKNTYTVVFDKNAEDATGTIASVTKEYNEEVEIGSGYAREGYEFIGWSLTANGNALYTEGDTLYLTENVTLYAVWDEIPRYTISFNKNAEDATGTVDSITNYVNEVITISSSFERSGYMFKGYATSATGNVAYEVGDTLTLTGNQTLYAVWEQIKEEEPVKKPGCSSTIPGAISGLMTILGFATISKKRK